MSSAAERDLRWRLANPITSGYSSLRGTAKSRGLMVTITKDEYGLLIKKPCHYCGGPLSTGGHRLDRIDSSMGYVSGNCTPCCSVCNYAKHSMSESEFKTWVRQVHDYWAKL